MVRQHRSRLLRTLIVSVSILTLQLAAYAQSLFTVGLEYDSKGNPTHVVVTGKLNESADSYLGASIYATGISDALTQGKHFSETLTAGQPFTKKFALNGVTSGTFEVALWGKKIPKNLAADPNNYFVKLWGYQLDTQRGYLSGWIMPLPK